jgi:putative sugar O-methyltransferase
MCGSANRRSPALLAICRLKPTIIRLRPAMWISYDGTMTPLTATVLADVDRIAAAQNAADDDADSFWREFGKTHRESIAHHGFETFKRHVSGYGSWQITKFSSRFTLRCLAALLRRGKLPALAWIDWRDAEPMPIWGESVHDKTNPAQRLRAYAFYCGLIWQYAALHDKLGCLRLAEPSLGKPLPVWLHGRLISQDLANAALDMNAMAGVIPLVNARCVLEIGAGYGRLAYIFASLFPDVEYTIADISPALAVSQNYLLAVTSAKKFHFVLPHELDDMPHRSFDLVINVSSFDEMPPPVQNRYLQRIDRLCCGHLYLSGYYRHIGERVGLDALPYPRSWTLLLDRGHEVFPLWCEKVFAIQV